nr:hypothetical protein [Saccharolobus solfataricus]
MCSSTLKWIDEKDYGWGEALVAGSGIINSYLSIINDIEIPLYLE